MPLACRLYVTSKCLGDQGGCSDLCRSLGARARGLLEAGVIKGFAARVLRSVEDIQYEDLDEELILEATGGVLPVVWLNLTYQHESFDVNVLRGIEGEFGLNLLLEYVQPW